MAVVQKQCKNVEYQFCKICKRNHNDGRKHIYSNKHKQKLASVLKKFGSKVHKIMNMSNVWLYVYIFIYIYIHVILDY